MQLTLKNIAKIKEAKIDINTITVIAGENNTGKSTVSRSLFAVFNSFSNIGLQIQEEKAHSIANKLRPLIFNYMDSIEDFHNFITKDDIFTRFINIDDIDTIKNLVQETIKLKDGIHIDENILEGVATSIKAINGVSHDDFLKELIENRLNFEFNNQICNVFSDEGGEIKLQIQDKFIDININNDNSIKSVTYDNLSLFAEALYIDDPFVLDKVDTALIKKRAYNHQDHLLIKLSANNSQNTIEEVLVKQKLEHISELLAKVCNGDIVVDKKDANLYYKRHDSDKTLKVKNLSTGIKAFVILKMLLAGGIIKDKGVVIFDEPEVHLHPKWQLIFAELIVLIQKEFDLHILLNTHSPYFLRAIEVYADKYNISDSCKFYLANTDEKLATIEDISNDIAKAYKKLYEPLQELENILWE